MFYAFLKRLFDLFFSLLGIVILSPVIIIIAGLIKLTSSGPVFFRQKRVGKEGVFFRIFKFRTMVSTAASGPMVTAKDDSRITSIGLILRQTKLDEVPQLFNVFWGTMSFVGPRPEIPDLVKFYTEEQKELLILKPGITSPATIYHRDEEEIAGTAEEIEEYHRTVLIPKKASYDLAYMQRRSFTYDLRIILLTLLSVITNESGYVREKAVKNRRAIIIAAIIILLVIAYILAYLLRFAWDIPIFYIGKLKRTIPLVIMIKLVSLAYFGQLEGYLRYVSIRDVVGIFKALFLSALTMVLMEYFFLDNSFPTSVVGIDFVISLMLLSGQRLSLRLLREIYAPIVPKSRERALILGAGDKAERLYRELRQNPDLAYDLLGFIDSDARKIGVRIHAKKVLGTFTELPGLIESKGVTVLINTYDKLDQNQTAILTKMRAQFKCSIRNVPSAADYITGKISTKRIKEISIVDLLGRETVELDHKKIEAQFSGKRIMITGAGGSIGSELVRQIVRFNPEELLLLDKDETLLYEIETDLRETGVTVPLQVLIGDIRNSDRMDIFFSKFRPQVVLHSAAYKHVPLMEVHPHEAVQNNVFGTMNVLTAAQNNGVERFVMISTDKAVKSTNIMGATKRLAEMIMFKAFDQGAMKCMAVRFGNVLGSRGSVIPLFQRQIDRGGPVYITDPEIRRFFMSIPEAAQLVLQAGAMSRGGEIFILKMGEPVKIKNLAYRLIEFNGYIPEVDIDVQYTGLRPGEKLYEELLTDLEGAVTTNHEKIMVINKAEDRDAQFLEKALRIRDNLFDLSNAQIRYYLKDLVPDYAPQKETEAV